MNDGEYKAWYIKTRDELAALQQRSWVGLTDKDILVALDLVGYDTQAFTQAYAIEAKLKEKNT